MKNLIRLTVAQLWALANNTRAAAGGSEYHQPKLWVLREGEARPSSPIAWARDRHGETWILCPSVDAPRHVPTADELAAFQAETAAWEANAGYPLGAASFDPNVGLDE